RPTKPVAMNVPPAPITNCPLFLEVCPEPEPKPKSKVRGAKHDQVEVHVLGPRTLELAATFSEFLKILAEMAFAAGPDELVLESLRWRWCKSCSVKGDCLPVVTTEGFDYMMEQIGASDLGKVGMLVIVMDQPREKDEKIAPWIKAAKVSHKLAEGEKENTEVAKGKKLSLDKQLEPIRDDLMNRSGEYAGRNRRRHPGRT
ncbi:hypothetical protein BJ138DRAFT_994714, partial [Hygrophoropsis aurantiaca]